MTCMSPVYSINCKIVRAVDTEETAGGWSLQNCPQQWDALQILLFHNNHRYFLTHRAPTKPSFTLSTHLIFVLYFREFLDIPFRGRVRFCLLFDLVQNILAFKNVLIMYAAHDPCSLVGSVFNLKFFRWRFDPAQEPSLFSFLFLFFGTLECQPFSFFISIIATWEKRE